MTKWIANTSVGKRIRCDESASYHPALLTRDVDVIGPGLAASSSCPAVRGMPPISQSLRTCLRRRAVVTHYATQYQFANCAVKNMRRAMLIAHVTNRVTRS